MTTYTVETLLQAMDECVSQIQVMAIQERALELAAAQPSEDGTCQFCGGVGCVRCDARKQPSASEPVAWTDMAKVWESFEFIEAACSCHDQERGGSSDEDLAIVRAALESFAATRAQD